MKRGSTVSSGKNYNTKGFLGQDYKRGRRFREKKNRSTEKKGGSLGNRIERKTIKRTRKGGGSS